MKRVLIFVLFLFFGLSFCTKKKAGEPDDVLVVQQARLSLKPVFDSEDLYLDSVYTLSNGYKIQFLELKAYFSDIQSGGTILKDVALFNYRENGTLIFQANQVMPNPTSIQFGIGVPAIVNHNDPSTFANTNPLNIAIANDMHWDWNPGYIFFKIEAKVDTIADAVTNCDLSLVYHVGTDTYFTTKTVSNLNWSAVSSTLNEAWLKLNLKNFFENPVSPIDVKTETDTHSSAAQAALTEKVRQNFASSLSAL
ncbi:MbnP family protein [Fluviicola sp.]|jgi:hypothetical protein|uniref:MbnP family protein n=1 Tax=Fluviicola sp. TaxID=1917219 RepID=UPI002836EA5C|nr:MbnP family protein [Fluviicola sp.]MDR0801003.1 hypothetical protein [Fluviicola sp.]